MSKASAKFNIYDHVTQTILAQLEAGTVPWRKGWTGDAIGLELPKRSTGQHYRGINILMLWAAAQTQGFNSPTWMTYRQAQSLGGQVRKGEKSSTVVKYGTFDAESGPQNGDDVERRAYARAYRVFNVEQIEGLDVAYYPTVEPARDLGTQGDPDLEAWFASLGVPIDTTDEAAAYYTPATDRIHMPPIGTFRSSASYFGTLAHEAAHATKAKHRLDRKHPGKAQERYAREEVVAELSAAMVSSRLGIQTEFEQNAAYLDHWIGVMKEDNRAIIRAASMAQAASDWMFDTAGAAPAHLTKQLAA